MKTRNNRQLYTSLWLLACSLILPFSVTHAENWSDKVTIKGFASSVYQKTNEAEYFGGEATENGIDENGSVLGTRLGININANISDRVTIASQLIATAADNYVVHVDWAFIALNLTDDLTLRTGKVKYPVGIVNEYRDVGYLYPWISAPMSVYSLVSPNGPQATREAFSGSSLLWGKSFDTMTYSADLFAGEVNLSGSDVRSLTGLTLRADWDDKVLFQASQYKGTMYNATVTAMNGKDQEATVFGVKIDWNNYIAYAETSDVKMGSLTAMKSKSSYVTLGYRFGKWLPFVTAQKYEQGEVDDKQSINQLGLRYDLWSGTAIKFEVGTIKTDKGQGLFDDGAPSKDSVSLYGVAIDTTF